MTCTIQGCAARAVGRGYCNRHWKRWRKFGDPLIVPPPRASTPELRAAIAAGVARAWHEGRFSREHPADCGHCKATRGVPKPPRTQAAKDAVSARRRAERDPSYQSMHHSRLLRDRGRASDFPCVQCGERAREWAMMAPPEEFVRRAGKRTWSVRTSDYEAMCKPCHERLDRARRKAREWAGFLGRSPDLMPNRWMVFYDDGRVAGGADELEVAERLLDVAHTITGPHLTPGEISR